MPTSIVTPQIEFEKIAWCEEHQSFIVFIPNSGYWCIEGGEQITTESQITYVVGKVYPYVF